MHNLKYIMDHTNCLENLYLSSKVPDHRHVCQRLNHIVLSFPANEALPVEVCSERELPPYQGQLRYQNIILMNNFHLDLMKSYKSFFQHRLTVLLSVERLFLLLHQHSLPDNLNQPLSEGELSLDILPTVTISWRLFPPTLLPKKLLSQILVAL